MSLVVQSQLLVKYRDSLEENYKKIRRIVPGKEVVFDELPWSAFKITLISTVLSKIDLFKYLIEVGFIDNSNVTCLKCKCKDKLSIVSNSSKLDSAVYQCNNKIPVDASNLKMKNCRSSRSIRSHSWFSRSHLQLSEILLFTYYWWNECKTKFIEEEMQLAHKTVIDWASFCREVVIDVMLEHSEPIGGVGMTVEIDESKFGKRKYHRGDYREGQWVFGGVERDSNKCFLVPVEERNAETLISLIKKWIKPGTIIISDCWKAYNRIEEHNGYQHLWVNHSVNFKDPETGAHTNTIEGLWQKVKYSLPQTHRKKEHFVGFLAAYMLRKKWKDLDGCLLFMKAAARLYKSDDAQLNVNTENV